MPAEDRKRVSDAPRATDGSEWEVFVRETSTDPMQHVGSVTADTWDLAYEQAAALFSFTAEDLWLCPADAVHRFTPSTLDEAATPAGD
ncbi:Htur_1727 family rSAM-partnered candidate RiPP [Haloarchaeobius amylolyticus]|uniref:Htur_1727 family rSAM-partnered candidate RiPP n=1 Tax=Haloarchaeobius amylolyticus TaxID=1198296 RepID=UPI00226F1286|nr:Htur_1727 family rSAM-partnered candidate RiPP [Haloarchaeobius amylolyticus]